MNAHRTGWRLLTVVACVGLAGRWFTRDGARAFAAGQTPPGAQHRSCQIFLQEMDGQQRGLKTAVFRRSAEFGVDEVATREAGAKISSREGGDAAWTTTVPVKPYSKYRLAAGSRRDLDRVPLGRLLSLHGLGELRTAGDRHAELDRGDARVRHRVQRRGPDRLPLRRLGRASGTAWYDDIGSSCSRRASSSRSHVDVTKTRAPIRSTSTGSSSSTWPLHLRRHLGGDARRPQVLLPVGSKESPWKPIGYAKVTMKGRAVRRVQTPESRWPAARRVASCRATSPWSPGSATRVASSWGGPTTAPVRVTWCGETLRRPRERHRHGARAGVPDAALILTSEKSSDKARLEITTEGRGVLRIGTISLMPADNVRGFAPTRCNCCAS